ncbi:MAG: cytochrome c [Betaproteobacteria bacterium]|nr:cytochrome c [Betaproteobacteria bacterium]
MMRAAKFLLACILAFPIVSVLAADLTPGRYLAGTCASCHGTDGKSVGSVPSLAGQSTDSLLSKIAEFKDGSRPGTIMAQIAKGYTDEQMRQIAEFFASQK